MPDKINKSAAQIRVILQAHQNNDERYLKIKSGNVTYKRSWGRWIKTLFRFHSKSIDKARDICAQVIKGEENENKVSTKATQELNYREVEQVATLMLADTKMPDAEKLKEHLMNWKDVRTLHHLAVTAQDPYRERRYIKLGKNELLNLKDWWTQLTEDYQNNLLQYLPIAERHSVQGLVDNIENYFSQNKLPEDTKNHFEESNELDLYWNELGKNLLELRIKQTQRFGNCEVTKKDSPITVQGDYLAISKAIIRLRKITPKYLTSDNKHHQELIGRALYFLLTGETLNKEQFGHTIQFQSEVAGESIQITVKNVLDDTNFNPSFPLPDNENVQKTIDQDHKAYAILKQLHTLSKTKKASKDQLQEISTVAFPIKVAKHISHDSLLNIQEYIQKKSLGTSKNFNSSLQNCIELKQITRQHPIIHELLYNRQLQDQVKRLSEEDLNENYTKKDTELIYQLSQFDLGQFYSLISTVGSPREKRILDQLVALRQRFSDTRLQQALAFYHLDPSNIDKDTLFQCSKQDIEILSDNQNILTRFEELHDAAAKEIITSKKALEELENTSSSKKQELSSGSKKVLEKILFLDLDTPYFINNDKSKYKIQNLQYKWLNTHTFFKSAKNHPEYAVFVSLKKKLESQFELNDTDKEVCNILMDHHLIQSPWIPGFNETINLTFRDIHKQLVLKDTFPEDAESPQIQTKIDLFISLKQNAPFNRALSFCRNQEEIARLFDICNGRFNITEDPLTAESFSLSHSGALVYDDWDSLVTQAEKYSNQSPLTDQLGSMLDWDAVAEHLHSSLNIPKDLLGNLKGLNPLSTINLAIHVHSKIGKDDTDLLEVYKALESALQTSFQFKIDINTFNKERAIFFQSFPQIKNDAKFYPHVINELFLIHLFGPGTDKSLLRLCPLLIQIDSNVSTCERLLKNPDDQQVILYESGKEEETIQIHQMFSEIQNWEKLAKLPSDSSQKRSEAILDVMIEIQDHIDSQQDLSPESKDSLKKLAIQHIIITKGLNPYDNNFLMNLRDFSIPFDDTKKLIHEKYEKVFYSEDMLESFSTQTSLDLKNLLGFGKIRIEIQEDLNKLNLDDSGKPNPEEPALKRLQALSEIAKKLFEGNSYKDPRITSALHTSCSNLLSHVIPEYIQVDTPPDIIDKIIKGKLSEDEKQACELIHYLVQLIANPRQDTFSIDESRGTTNHVNKIVQLVQVRKDIEDAFKTIQETSLLINTSDAKEPFLTVMKKTDIPQFLFKIIEENRQLISIIKATTEKDVFEYIDTLIKPYLNKNLQQSFSSAAVKTKATITPNILDKYQSLVEKADQIPHLKNSDYKIHITPITSFDIQEELKLYPLPKESIDINAYATTLNKKIQESQDLPAIAMNPELKELQELVEQLTTLPAIIHSMANEFKGIPLEIQKLVIQKVCGKNLKMEISADAYKEVISDFHNVFPQFKDYHSKEEDIQIARLLQVALFGNKLAATLPWPASSCQFTITNILPPNFKSSLKVKRHLFKPEGKNQKPILLNDWETEILSVIDKDKHGYSDTQQMQNSVNTITEQALKDIPRSKAININGETYDTDILPKFLKAWGENTKNKINSMLPEQLDQEIAFMKSSPVFQHLKTDSSPCSYEIFKVQALKGLPEFTEILDNIVEGFTEEEKSILCMEVLKMASSIFQTTSALYVGAPLKLIINFPEDKDKHLFQNWNVKSPEFYSLIFGNPEMSISFGENNMQSQQETSVNITMNAAGSNDLAAPELTFANPSQSFKKDESDLSVWKIANRSMDLSSTRPNEDKTFEMSLFQDFTVHWRANSEFIDNQKGLALYMAKNLPPEESKDDNHPALCKKGMSYTIVN